MNNGQDSPQEEAGKKKMPGLSVKILITAALLLFVGVSLAFLVVDEFGKRRANLEEPPQAADRQDPVAATVDDAIPRPAAAPHTVIAYYFHGTQRCVTCRTIEAYAEESLRTGFPDALEAGTLVWKVVDVSAPENEHFVSDYELSTRSVVLVDMREGEQRQWKNLVRVWELVRDKPSFLAYIQEETSEFLGD